jgi:alpha-glucoside transport system substrate-binding protein
MVRRPPFVGLLVLACVVVQLTACTTAQPAISGQVRVLGAWSGEELAAFRAVVAPFEERTSVTIEYVTTRDLRGVLDDELAAGTPPDIAGLEGPAHMRDLASRGALQDLGDVLDLGRYRSDVAPTFIDLGTVDGRLVGVFVRSAVKGLIWHDPQVFRLGTPRTWDELQRMATQAAGSAAAEWCVGLESEEASGWPGTDLIEQFLVRGSGIDDYDAWVAGNLPWTSPQVREAFELYGQVVADGAVFGGIAGALGTDFREAADPLFGSPPGCLFLHQGSFMPTYFPDGSEPGSDFDFFAFPRLGDEARGVVIGGGDLFGILTDDPAAAALMRYLVSDEAQTLWVSQGGSLSVKATVTAYPDTVTQRAAELLTRAEAFRFDASDQMPGNLNAMFWRAVMSFSEDQSRLDDLLAELEGVRLGDSSSPA